MQEETRVHRCGRTAAVVHDLDKLVIVFGDGFISCKEAATAALLSQ
jgi:hypothetical protein